MIQYQTVKLKEINDHTISVLYMNSKETAVMDGSIYDIIDDWNRNGYMLTAVDNRVYYLSKRID